MTQEEIIQRLLGKKITEVDFYRSGEGEELQITLDDHSVLIPMKDQAGTEPGILHCIFAEEEEVQTI